MSFFPIKRGWKPNENLNGDSIKKKRGRPKGSGLNPDKTVKAIRVTPDVEAMFEQWKREYGARTYDEALRMHLREKANNIAKRQKKLDALVKEQKEYVKVTNK